MNRKIDTLLPIALAAILPGLGLYTNTGLEKLNNFGMMFSWLVGSIILYLFWYSLWYLWDLESRYKQWLFVLVPGAFTGIVSVIMFFTVVQGGVGFKWHYPVRIMMASVLFIAIQYALKAQQNIARLQLEKEQIQTENYKVQLKALRNKVDPHFLFNSLNTLRSMVRHQNDNSEEFIMSLSDFYRQTLKHNENTTLQLSEELEVLNSYLFLMKSRSEEAINVKIEIDEALHQHHLPTLALQVVVENCFKHNSMTSKRPLLIEVYSTNDGFIAVRNNIQPKIGDREDSGYGLDLLRRRYELMKVDNGLIVEKTPDQFTVRLKLI